MENQGYPCYIPLPPQGADTLFQWIVRGLNPLGQVADWTSPCLYLTEEMAQIHRGVFLLRCVLTGLTSLMGMRLLKWEFQPEED